MNITPIQKQQTSFGSFRKIVIEPSIKRAGTNAIKAVTDSLPQIDKINAPDIELTISDWLSAGQISIQVKQVKDVFKKGLLGKSKVVDTEELFSSDYLFAKNVTKTEQVLGLVKQGLQKVKDYNDPANTKAVNEAISLANKLNANK